MSSRFEGDFVFGVISYIGIIIVFGMIIPFFVSYKASRKGLHYGEIRCMDARRREHSSGVLSDEGCPIRCRKGGTEQGISHHQG